MTQTTGELRGELHKIRALNTRGPGAGKTWKPRVGRLLVIAREALDSSEWAGRELTKARAREEMLQGELTTAREDLHRLSQSHRQTSAELSAMAEANRLNEAAAHYWRGRTHQAAGHADDPIPDGLKPRPTPPRDGMSPNPNMTNAHPFREIGQ